MALMLLHVQYARQWPAGGLNDSVYVNWRGPAPVSFAARGDGSLLVSLETLDGAGVFLNDTHDCWECCTRARDTFQVRAAPGCGICFLRIAVADQCNHST